MGIQLVVEKLDGDHESTKVVEVVEERALKTGEALELFEQLTFPVSEYCHYFIDALQFEVIVVTNRHVADMETWRRSAWYRYTSTQPPARSARCLYRCLKAWAKAW